MMQYVYCLCNVHYQSTAICRKIICVDIELEYFCGNIIITTRRRYVFFCEYNAQNSSMELVWKYGRLSSIPFLKSSIPFHSGIFHIPYRNFRSIPYHALFTAQFLRTTQGYYLWFSEVLLLQQKGAV